MNDAYIVDAIRTPFGRYGGALSSVRTDDLGAIPIKALIARNPKVDWAAIVDVLYGCANQAGEDNRNVARMSALLAGLPMDVPGATINRLCGSGLDALGSASRAIRCGEALPSASSPEPHRRLIVAPGTSIGKPASSALMRATLRLSSPAWLAQPYSTSTIAAQSTFGLRAISALMGIAPRSSVRTELSAPP